MWGVKWGRCHGNEAYAILGHFRAHSVHFQALCVHFGAVCAHLGSFWGVLSLFGVILGRFVPIWGDFGVILGCVAEEEEVDKMMEQKLREEQEGQFGVIWGPFCGLLGSFWGGLSLFGVIFG